MILCMTTNMACSNRDLWPWNRFHHWCFSCGSCCDLGRNPLLEMFWASDLAGIGDAMWFDVARFPTIFSFMLFHLFFFPNLMVTMIMVSFWNLSLSGSPSAKHRSSRPSCCNCVCGVEPDRWRAEERPTKWRNGGVGWVWGGDLGVFFFCLLVDLDAKGFVQKTWESMKALFWSNGLPVVQRFTFKVSSWGYHPAILSPKDVFLQSEDLICWNNPLAVTFEPYLVASNP